VGSGGEDIAPDEVTEPVMSAFMVPEGSFVADVSEDNGITLNTGIILGKTVFSCRGVSREEPDVAELGSEYSLNQLTGAVHPDQARETFVGDILAGKITYEKRNASGARVFATLTRDIWKCPEWFKGKVIDEDEIARIKLASPNMAFPKGNEDVIGKSAVVTGNFTAGSRGSAEESDGEEKASSSEGAGGIVGEGPRSRYPAGPGLMYPSFSG